MKIQTIENRMPELIGVLTQVWEDSVRATHHFLMPGDVERIKEYVPQAIGGIGKLAVAFNEQDRPVGFLGVEGEMIEMLFRDPAGRGNGLGRSMMDYAIKNFGASKVNVNEQNRGAKGFYEHMGFSVCRRTPRRRGLSFSAQLFTRPGKVFIINDSIFCGLRVSLMFKKTYYGAHIAPACAYCLHGSTAADPKMILCKRKGVVSPYYCCRKFSYDPLMRIPRRQVLPELDPRDFTLDD